MPILTRLFIKTGLIYFVAALVLGVLLAWPWDMVRHAGAPSFTIHLLRPVYFHLFMVGWVTQLIIGVALWMFPKFSRELPRGSEPIAWICFVALNSGLLLRAVVEPWNMASPSSTLGTLVALSALLQLIGGWAFVANIWMRVKER